MNSIFNPQDDLSNLVTFKSGKYVPAFLFLILSCFPLLVFGDDYAIQRIVDDAYYYIVIGENLIDVGESSFLPGIPTNGYHPLWLILVTAVGGLFGFSLTSIKLLEVAVIFAGFVMFIRLFRIQTFLEASFYTFSLWYILYSFSLVAMETSLLFPALVFFFATILSDEKFFSSRRSVTIIFSSCIVIGTRLDSAFFVIPILFVAPVSSKEKLHIFLGIFTVAAVYAVLNHVIFGTALPVSGSVKSLGGLQLNDHYKRQVIRDLSLINILNIKAAGSPWVFATLALISTRARRQTNSNSLVSAVIVASIIGLILFGAKLLFGSSWAIWNWYGYPAIIFSLPIIWMVSTRNNGRLLSIGMIFLTAFLFREFAEKTLVMYPSHGFAEINRQFIDEFSGLLAGETVAMGDRSGSFAYFYDGGVYQTEGLVNRKEYLTVLKNAGDLRAHLCREGVNIFVDYEPIQENYISMDIEILRSSSTSFAGPHIKVHQFEEIAQHNDPSIFGSPIGANWDDRIYAWRLEC